MAVELTHREVALPVKNFKNRGGTVIQLSLPEGERTDSNMTGPSIVVVEIFFS
jgi:hypothetical protein